MNCTILYLKKSAVLYCTVPAEKYRTAQYCAVLYSTCVRILYCNALYCTLNADKYRTVLY